MEVETAISRPIGEQPGFGAVDNLQCFLNARQIGRGVRGRCTRGSGRCRPWGAQAVGADRTEKDGIPHHHVHVAVQAKGGAEGHSLGKGTAGRPEEASAAALSPAREPQLCCSHPPTHTHPMALGLH